MIEVRPTNILTFSHELSARLPYAATYYVGYANMLGKLGFLFSAYSDGVPCGIAVMGMLPNEKAATIAYVAVMEKYRGGGVCKRLIDACMSCAQSLGVAEVHCRMTHEEGEEAPLTKYQLRLGFVRAQSSVTVIIQNSKTTIYEWFTFLKRRGNRLIRRIEKNGFTFLPYSEVGQEVLDTIASQAGTRFPTGLEPLTARLQVLMDNSYVALKDGAPAAYCQLATADNGKNVIVQGLASAFEYHHRGAYFPCLANVISDVLTVTCSAKTAFTFYSVNNEMESMLNTFLNFTEKSVKYQDFYVCHFTRGETVG